MPGPSLTCPECDFSFPAPASASSEITCPICDTVIPVRQSTSAASPGRPSSEKVSSQGNSVRRSPAQPTVRASAPPQEEESEPAPIAPKLRTPRRPERSGNRAVLWVLGGIAAFLLLGVGLGMFVLNEIKKGDHSREDLVASQDKKDKNKEDAKKTEDTAKRKDSTKNTDKNPGTEKNPDPLKNREDPKKEKKDPVEKRDPIIEKKDPVERKDPVEKKNPAPEITRRQAEINKAIDRGTAFVQRWVTAFHEDRLKVDQHKDGVISLMGLTLLECGVKPDEPSMQKIARFLRERSDKIAQTYDLATAILFLDRLGNPRDKDLIQTFALRIVAGQNTWGSWTYSCPILSKEDEEMLLSFLKTRNYANPDAPGIKDADFQESLKLLPVRLRDLPIAKKRYTPKFSDAPGDNSNTQFALLALWVAKRQGLPTQPSLGLVDRYFRAIQNEDGSWGYGARNHQWVASMTCSGLLGLAVGRSVIETSEKGQVRDPEIEKGFAFLTTKIGAKRQDGSTGKIIGADAHGDLYFLWSLERVAMVYDLKKIGGKDWYDWASGVLLDSQKTLERLDEAKKNGKIDPDKYEDELKKVGSWQDLYPGPIDTCFALLVLNRVNIAKDLTQDVKKVINIKDLEKQK
jgi:hypothetical protein